MNAPDASMRLHHAPRSRPGGRPGVDRPIALLILALGGEGGGVLHDWVVDTALAAGLPVQGTSVPGVAQRTGATSYYVEMMATASARSPVFCLAPTPGRIDLLVSSELLETARAIERGLADPDLTTSISSTSRFLTVAEKSQMADGRYDPANAIEAIGAMSREAILFDMAAETQAAGTVISAVMFGAIAASGVLPLARAQCEATIRAGGRGAQASLEGFRRGYEAVSRARETPAVRASDGALEQAGAAPADVANEARSAAREAPADTSIAAPHEPATPGAALPAALAELLALGAARMRDFQDDAYADEYLARMQRLVDAERASGDMAFAVSRTAARFLALWMAYEDVIRVADLKSRPERIARVRREVGARDDEPIVVREFLKPGVDEIAAILPPSLAGRLLAWARRRARTTFSEGVQLATTSVHGSLALRTLAALRPLRRRSSRFLAEQAAIERWLDALLAVLARATAGDAALAREIAECPRVLKGYGETHARGRRSFAMLMDTLIAPPLASGECAADRAAAIRRAREAALADPEGRTLAAALGLPPPAPKAQPIRWMNVKRRDA